MIHSKLRQPGEVYHCCSIIEQAVLMVLSNGLIIDTETNGKVKSETVIFHHGGENA